MLEDGLFLQIQQAARIGSFGAAEHLFRDGNVHIGKACSGEKTSLSP